MFVSSFHEVESMPFFVASSYVTGFKLTFAPHAKRTTPLARCSPLCVSRTEAFNLSSL